MKNDTYKNNDDILLALYQLLNKKFFDNRICGIPRFTMKTTKTVTVNMNTIDNGGLSNYYYLEIPISLLPDAEEIAIRLMTEMILIDFSINDYESGGTFAKTSSNRGIYKNSMFAKACEERGFATCQNGIYGFKIDKIPEELKEELKQYKFSKCNVYVKNYERIVSESNKPLNVTRKKPTSTRKYMCSMTGESFRATKNISVMDCARFLNELKRGYLRNGIIAISEADLKKLITKYQFEKV